MHRRVIIGAGAAAIALALSATITAASTNVAPRPFLRSADRVQVRDAPLLTSGLHSGEHALSAFPRVGAERRVIVETSTPAAARRAIEVAGGRVESSWRNLVQAVVPAGAINALAARPAIDTVRPPMTMIVDAVSGEEVAASLAPAWHAKGLTGKGVKVAIIDGGFQGLAERQASGDLPANVVTQDICGGRFGTAEDHGTAVAEIVHEMAPEAQLYLVCVDTEVDLANAGAYAQSQGVQVISHSASWFGPDRGDGSGPIGAVAAAARAAGILWVNSAGNYAQTHWSGTFASADGDRAHDWAPGDEGNTFVWPNDSEICGFLRWDEWPVAASDYDLVLFHSATGTPLAVSADDQTGTQPAFEGLCVGQRTGVDLTVAWGISAYAATGTPRMDLFVFAPPLQYQVAAGSIGEPATSSATLAVGALCWQSRQPEPYTSQGPTIDGRMKPDIAAHDSVSGATYGPFSACGMSGFAGTSASAPEVAGAAALVKQAFPSYTPDQLQQYLVKSVVDVGTPGADNVTGAGELQLAKPPDLVPPTSKALASSGKPGKIVKLLSSVADDEGTVSVVEQVKRNGTVVRTIKQPGTFAATSPRTVAVPWQAPAKPKGSYQHCVVAIDAAGNKSPQSCAKVTLR